MNKSFLFTFAFLFIIMSACKKEEIDGPGGITISGSVDGHDYVDLGLSVKWATKNIGANRSSDYGDYFAWGEINPKSTFNLNNYKWYDSPDNSYTKYCNTSDYGIVDNKSTLEPIDDAAHRLWGNSWRMPTREEMDELRTKCDWWFATHNGVNGCFLIGPNGHSIFFPFNGSYSEYNFSGGQGTYWSSSNDSQYPDKAYVFFVTEGSLVLPIVRYYGRGIRPVTDK